MLEINLAVYMSALEMVAWEVQEQLVDHYFEGQLQALPLNESECITEKQYRELINKIRFIAHTFHMQESAESKLSNMLRFKLNVGGVKDIPAVDFEKAKAILECARSQNSEILQFRIALEKEILENYLCQGIPFTGTLRKQFKKAFSMRLPKNPNWRSAVDMLEVATH